MSVRTANECIYVSNGRLANYFFIYDSITVVSKTEKINLAVHTSVIYSIYILAYKKKM